MDVTANVYGDEAGVRNAISETLMLGRMVNSIPEVAAFLRQIPWFDGIAVAQQMWYYHVIDRFQQCNKAFQIGGRQLQSYFPSWSAELPALPSNGTIVSALNMLMLCLVYRRLVMTGKGYIGAGPMTLRRGDHIYLLAGCRVPLVLRPDADGGFKLVGECYIHGLMNGEAFEGLEDGSVKLEMVRLS
jgi:hypothetical protein